MQKKIKYYYQQIPWSSLKDTRNLSMIAFLIIVLLISWSGVKALQTNYNLQKQISVLNQQNNLQQLQNINQQLQNQYYSTNQYLDITARQEFGLGSPGETELIVPKSVALSHVPAIAATAQTPNSINHKPAYQHNFQAWIDFIFHKENAN